MIGQFYLNDEEMFAAYDADARNIVDKLIVDRLYALDVLYPRDLHLQRKIFGKISSLAKLIGAKPEDLRAQLLVATGRFKLITTFERRPVIAINSMSPREMKDVELEEFWTDAVRYLESRVLPKFSEEIQLTARGHF